MSPAQQSFDVDGRAHQALVAIVGDYGIDVLSNPTMLANLCADEELDHDARREANLIVDAARDDVRTLLQQQARAVGPEGAVELTARTIAEQRSLDPEAARWVVREFALVMGLQLGAAQPESDLSDTVAPAPATEEPDQAPQVAPREPAVVAQEAAVAAQEAAVAAQDVAETPERSEAAADETAAAGALEAEGAPPPPAWAAAAPGVTQPPTTAEPTPPPGSERPARARRTTLRRPAVIVPVALVIIGGVIVALVFTVFKSSTNYQATLNSLIPASIKSNGCSTDSPSKYVSPQDQVGAQIDCQGPVGAVGEMRYVIFTSSSGLNQSYSDIVHNDAHTTIGQDNCGNFTTFVNPCETEYFAGNNRNDILGHVVEFFTQQTPAIVFTDTANNVEVIMVGESNANGNALAQYFGNNGQNLVNR